MRLKIENGFIKNREGNKLEFKQTFQKKQKEYIRTICAFANNSGGNIIFGVSDNPRKPIGLLGNKYTDFINYDQKDLNNQILNTLSGEIIFKISDFEQNGFKFGYLEVKEAKIKPIICKVTDSNQNLREGAIYYRYSSENKEIQYNDLIRIIENEKNKERKIFLEHIDKILKSGVHNVGVFNYEGELFAGDKKVILDENLVKNLKFIKEGEFVEKNGAPAVILKGEIKNIESLEVLKTNIDPNFSYPYEGQKEVIEKLIEKGISKEIYRF